MIVATFEAKNNLSKLIAAAEAGEEVLIARHGQPIVKLVKYDAPKLKPPGSWSGRILYSEDWDSPETNKEIEDLFYGSD